MAPRIICFVGAQGVGKDTACDALRAYGFKTHAHADALREAASAIFGLTPHQMSDRQLKEAPAGVEPWPELSPRDFLKLLGTECLRAHFPGAWIAALSRRIAGQWKVTVSDTRFFDEYEALRAQGAVFVRIENPRVPVSKDGHQSEMEWPLFGVDHVLINDADTADGFKCRVLDWYANILAGSE
jgi:hypothetical protein